MINDALPLSCSYRSPRGPQGQVRASLTSHTGHPPPGGQPHGDAGPGSTGEPCGCTGGLRLSSHDGHLPPGGHPRGHQGKGEAPRGVLGISVHTMLSKIPFSLLFLYDIFKVCNNFKKVFIILLLRRSQFRGKQTT